jgi:hypothetical protein
LFRKGHYSLPHHPISLFWERAFNDDKPKITYIHSHNKNDSQNILYWLSKTIIRRIFSFSTVNGCNRPHLAIWNHCAVVVPPHCFKSCRSAVTKWLKLHQLQKSSIWTTPLSSEKDWPQWSVSSLSQVEILHFAVSDRLPLPMDFSTVLASLLSTRVGDRGYVGHFFLYAANF